MSTSVFIFIICTDCVNYFKCDFLQSAEIAVLSMNETKLERMAEQVIIRAKRLVRLTQEPAKISCHNSGCKITLSGFLEVHIAAG